ncbi:MAG: hypothetical protein JSV17_13910 [Candidatus Aminicenantes bacterium]|nr:MAG: hypothetical protein JSV17_13910 [Candidatus Aminicenantes bacterium]
MNYTREEMVRMQNSETWRSFGPMGGDVISVNVSPVNPDEIYILVYCNYSMSCIYKSTNSGQNWTKTATLNRGCYDMVIHPHDPKILFVLSSSFVLKSTNGGASWTEYDLGYRTYAAYGQISINPINPDILHVAGYHDPGSSGFCMAAFKSTDGGVNWTTKDIKPNSQYGRAYCIAMNPSSPNILYLGGYYSDGSNYYDKLYKSTNSGDSWQDMTGSIQACPYSIIVDPTNPSKVYVGTTWGVYRSSNSGNTWTKSTGGVYAYALGIDPSNPNTIYAGWDKKCYKSTDGGVNWTAYAAGLCGICQDVLAYSGRVYYGSYAGLYKSLDGGTTWKASHAGIKHNVVPAIAVARSSLNVIYAEGSQNGLFKSTDFGNSWSRLPDFYRCDSIYTICVNSSNPDDLVLLAGG